jgi:hypothetical protein
MHSSRHTKCSTCRAMAPMLPRTSLLRTTYLGSTRSQAVPRLPHIITLTVLVVAANRGAGRVTNSSMVVSIPTAGQIIVRDHPTRRIATGGEYLFNHHMAVQMLRVRRLRLILNLATTVVGHGNGLTAIRHPQAMVTLTAQITNHPLATVVHVHGLVHPHKVTQEHEQVVTPLLRVDKHRKGRTPTTGTRPRRLHRQRRQPLLVRP